MEDPTSMSLFSCSVFEGMNIPYPTRKFLTDDENGKDDKTDKVYTYTVYTQRFDGPPQSATPHIHTYLHTIPTHAHTHTTHTHIHTPTHTHNTHTHTQHPPHTHAILSFASRQRMTTMDLLQRRYDSVPPQHQYMCHQQMFRSATFISAMGFHMNTHAYMHVQFMHMQSSAPTQPFHGGGHELITHPTFSTGSHSSTFHHHPPGPKF